MKHSSAYLDRLQRELVEASWRLHRERLEQADIQRPEADRHNRGAQRRVEARHLKHMRIDQASWRTHSRRTRIVFTLTGAAAGIAGVTAIALTFVGLAPETQRAFAGWTPSPAALASGQAAAAETSCLTKIRTYPELQRMSSGEWRVLIADTRGPYAMVALQATNGNAETSCFSGPWGTYITGAGGGGRTPTSVPAGQIRATGSGDGSGEEAAAPGTKGEQRYSRVIGRSGSGVTGVTLVLSDGTHVTASIANGWYLAWWPGTQEAVTAEVMTASGVNSQQISTRRRG